MISPKVSKLLNILPRNWVIYVSKKIANYYLNKYADIEVLGKENIDNLTGPVVYICNHLSNSDGLVLDKVLKDKDVTFIAGVKLSNDPTTNLGINIVKSIQIKPNSADKDALTKVIKTVKEGNSIVIFPEGTRSRTGSLIEAKKGVLLIARLSKATIVPIGMYGTEQLLPINECGNMAAECFRHSKVTVNIGKPIKLSEKEKDEDRHSYDERCLTNLMKEIAVLLPEKYRGIYK